MAVIVFAAPTLLAFCGRQGHMLGDVCGKEGRGSHSRGGEAGCLRSLGPAEGVRSCVRWSNRGHDDRDWAAKVRAHTSFPLVAQGERAVPR